MTDKPKILCSICWGPYSDYGHNAQPLPGRCCDACNAEIVMPLRMMVQSAYEKRGKPGQRTEQIDGPPPDAEIDANAGHALDLIQRMDGNVEFARRTWTAAFEEAERLDHNISADADDLSSPAIALPDQSEH